MRRRRRPYVRLTILALAVLAGVWAMNRDGPTGAAVVHDGDTLTVAGDSIRLYGVDAPELAQTCRDRTGAGYACGRLAKRALERLIDGDVRCRTVERDRYDRAVSICHAGGRDLGAALVSAGWARAYLRYSLRYAAAEDTAKAAGRGLWDGDFEDPWAYRRGGYKDDAISAARRWVLERLFRPE